VQKMTRRYVDLEREEVLLVAKPLDRRGVETKEIGSQEKRSRSGTPIMNYDRQIQRRKIARSRKQLSNRGGMGPKTAQIGS